MWFDGLIPCAEDWHTKVILLEVIIIINGIKIHPYILKYIKHIQTCLRTSIYIYTFILQVVWKYMYYYNRKSAQEHGTMYQ